MTLNSVDYETEILLKINDKIKKVKIGEYIDNHIESIEINDIEKHPNDTTLAWIKKDNVEIMSCDVAGKMHWKKVEAVTQHPVINEDGTNTLLKVILKSGREVSATKAKSFLMRINNEIVPVNGKDLRVGDRLPVSTVLHVDKELTHINLSDYLSKKDFLFMSEVDKALQKIKETRQWYQKYHGKEFTLPYTRSDAFYQTFVSKKEKRKQEYVKDCVYPAHCSKVTSQIPETFELDEDFGFFVGAYLAEGHATTQHAMISNNNAFYREAVSKFFDKYKINHHTVARTINNGLSTDIRSHSSVLAVLMRDNFGELSHSKKLPAELIFANKEFLKSLINGYFSGDGTIRTYGGSVSVLSVSRELLNGIQQVLLRFGIVSNIKMIAKNKKEFKNPVQQPYNLELSYDNAFKFAQTFTLIIKEKQELLDKIKNTYTPKFTNGPYDIIPNVVLSDGTINIHRDTIMKKMENANEKDKDVLNKILEEECIYDEIVKIQEVPSSKTYVYDLTVADTRTFNTFTGICQMDTFHLSGVSSASKAVRGVPRIKELLSVTKNIKSPSMTVYLAPEIKRDKFKSTQVLNSVETTYFKDIVTSVKIFYDPNDFDTKIDDDKDFLSTYKDFYKNIPDLSPWLLRMELNKEKLNQYNITMIDIFHVLNDFYNKSVNLMFSDDNSNKLIFRIKLIDPSDNKSLDEKDMITSLKALEKNIMESLIIKGIKKITKVSMNKKESDEYNTETMKFEKAHEWVLETFGSNLIDIMCHKNVDNTKTVSNNINEIYELLGIEAARQALYNEIWEVIRDGDLYLNYRHLALLVDTMTNKGYLLSIDRHGINRVDIGPLAKSSFEETTDMLIKAGIFSEVDKINGVSANIMLGQIPPCGTGDTDILIDESKLSELLCTLETVEEEEPVDEETIENICSLDNLTFDFTLPAVDKTIKEKNIKVTIKK